MSRTTPFCCGIAFAGGGDKFPPTTFRVDVPTGGAIFPGEIMKPPRAWVDRRYNVQRWTRMPRGGHFPAMEEPALLVDDKRAFFRPLRAGAS